MGSKKISSVVLKKMFRGKEILERFKLQTALIREPFQLMYQIHEGVFLGTFKQEMLQFAQYDIAQQKWNVLPNDTVQEYDA